MKRIILVCLVSVLWGCSGSKMSAKANCNFEADKINGTYYHWITPGKTNCTFVLESPIKKSKEVMEFATAFYFMFQAIPSSGTANIIIQSPTYKEPK